MRSKGPHKATGLYAHVTWHTWRRERSVSEQDASIVKRAVAAAAQRTRMRIYALEVLSEHVHVVVRYPSDATISAFIREAKSESARRVNEVKRTGRLRWCRGHYAGSLSRSHVRAASVYVARQRLHHPGLLPRSVG